MSASGRGLPRLPRAPAARFRLPASLARFPLHLLLAVTLTTGCAHNVTRQVRPPADVDSLRADQSPYLKVHTRDGRLYVLRDWTVSKADSVCRGSGDVFDARRERIGMGPQAIPLDSVALFETNQVRTSGATTLLAALTVVTAGIAIYCASDPKACFGSCPTFYLTDGAKPVLAAEGFSSSVAPSLEAKDVDALWQAHPRGRDFTLLLTNEALETHVIRHADVLAARRPPGGRVVAGPGGVLREALALHEPLRATGPEGDCVEPLRLFDGRERFSAADSTDLAAREVLELEFAAMPDTALGLVIASRQSLLTTYLFYQALAYMGRRAGDWVATLERGDAATRQRSAGVGRALGGIEVLVRNPAGEWTRVGEDRETGPIATDVRLVPLPGVGPGPVRVRLRLARGAWRLDQVALAVLGAPVEPRRLRPIAVTRGGEDDPAALAALLDPRHALVTLRGDHYELHYRLPEDFASCELLLESRGYYLEWMREAWLEEENPARAALMALRPEDALRTLAPEFKRREEALERTFWSSRYAQP